MDKNLSNWDEFIPFSMYLYNTTEYVTPGFQPYELQYGFPGKIPTSFTKTPDQTKQCTANSKENIKLKYENKINPLKCRNKWLNMT